MIWRISQETETGIDTWDSAIVVAPNSETARRIHPGGYIWNEKLQTWQHSDGDQEPVEYTGWSDPDDVNVELVGVTLGAALPAVLVASFNSM